MPRSCRMGDSDTQQVSPAASLLSFSLSVHPIHSLLTHAAGSNHLSPLAGLFDFLWHLRLALIHRLGLNHVCMCIYFSLGQRLISVLVLQRCFALLGHYINDAGFAKLA